MQKPVSVIFAALSILGCDAVPTESAAAPAPAGEVVPDDASPQPAPPPVDAKDGAVEAKAHLDAKDGVVEARAGDSIKVKVAGARTEVTTKDAKVVADGERTKVEAGDTAVVSGKDGEVDVKRKGGGVKVDGKGNVSFGRKKIPGL